MSNTYIYSHVMIHICIHVYYIITCEEFSSLWLQLLAVQFLIRPVCCTHLHALQRVSNDIPYTAFYFPQSLSAVSEAIKCLKY